MSAEPRTQRSVVAQLKLAQQILVADEDQREGRLAGQVESQQESQLFERAVGGVLRVVHDNDQGLALVLGEVAGKLVQVALAANAAVLAQAASQRG